MKTDITCEKTVNSSEILSDIQNLLRYHKNIGLAEYPHSPELENFLTRDLPDPVATNSTAAARPARPQQPAQHHEIVTPRQAPPSILPQQDNNLPELKTVDCEQLCQQCALRAKRLGYVAGRGGSSVRLLVVGGWRVHARELLESSVFGVEEDLMLARMFSAMKLSKDEVYVTNLVRCSLPENIRPDADSVATCLRLFQQQVRQLQPELICTMGTLASRAIIGKNQALSQLRGAFYQKELLDGATIPVFATYHPSFLLKNDEMKRPTWDDLQRAISRLHKKRN